MDESDKKIFQMKFIILTMMLNAVIILIAAGVLFFMLFHSVIWQSLAVVMFIGAIVLIFMFRKRYRDTKKWLDQHA